MAVPIALLEGSSPSILEGLGEMDLIGLDDLDGVAGDRAWEEALFALFNALYDRRAHLIITAKEPPGSLPLIIEDLRSRLTSGPVLAIKPLNPDQTAEALIIHAENRGIHLSNPVAEYLTKRVQRDLPSLLLWLEKIDQASLSAGRPMTIPMLRRLLESED
jgi:DnaA family protein